MFKAIKEFLLGKPEVVAAPATQATIVPSAPVILTPASEVVTAAKPVKKPAAAKKPAVKKATTRKPKAK